MPEPPDVDQIVKALNAKYATTLSRETIEIAVTMGFTSWEALRRECLYDAATNRPSTMFGHPLRVDATLCGPDELWIEGPTGDAVRVWPAPAKDPDA